MGWWCPTCYANVSGNQVTYEEYHETCGTYLGDAQELSEDDKIQAAIDFLYFASISPDEYEERYYKIKGNEVIDD